MERHAREPQKFIERAAVSLLLGLIMACGAAAQSHTKAPSPAKSAPVIQTEKIQVPQSLQAPPPSMANQPGYMLPGQTQDLLVKIWQAESRIRDLMSQAHPELLNMPPDQALTLGRALETLGQSLNALETARAKFAGRVDSEYLAFQAYAAMTNLRTPLRRVADLVSRYQSVQLGGMFKQAWNNLFTLEGSLQPYVAFLTRNHGQIYTLMQDNLYSCQNQLRAAMQKHPTHTKMIPNIVPFKPRAAHPTPQKP